MYKSRNSRAACFYAFHKYMRSNFARLVSFCLLFACVTAVAAQKRNITEKDLFDFVWIGQSQVSPDGSMVAFVKVTVNDKRDGYNTQIWGVSTVTGEMRQLTSGI